MLPARGWILFYSAYRLWIAAQEMFSKLLGKEVKVYLNLDGQGDAEEAPQESSKKIDEEKKSSPFVWVAIAVAVVGLGWWYWKSKKQ